jgi:hypothetical protein
MFAACCHYNKMPKTKHTFDLVSVNISKHQSLTLLAGHACCNAFCVLKYAAICKVKDFKA